MKAYSYIRFSSPEQLKGDSLRRQTEATQEYCKRNGYNLDESLSMRDLGVSAYRGVHSSKGALGEFLKLVDAGKIETGSVLIVENLDRLSRQEVTVALSHFTNIINAGIKLVTLSDNMEYSKESINTNWTQLIMSIAYMARAHDESEIKSKRLKSAWSNKRQIAKESQKEITTRCPFWLTYINGHFEPVPEVVEVIKKIYEMRLNGIGPGAISTRLNQINVWKPTRNNRNKSGGWQKCYVSTILRTRSLIGEFQPRCREGKSKKEIAGEPIPNYYPAVIDLEMFNAVQNYNHKISQIKGNTGGQIGKVHNLFASLVKCGICGGAMHYIGKQSPYLHCDISRRKTELNGIKCKARPVRYDEFQEFVLHDLEELNVEEVFQDNEEMKMQLKQLENEVESTSFEIVELERKMNNLLEELSLENNKTLRQAIKSKWETLEMSSITLKKQLEQSKFKLAEFQLNGKTLKENIDTSMSLKERMLSIESEEDAIELRYKLRNALRKIIKEINVYPLNRRYKRIEEHDTFPNLLIVTDSKSIEKIRIRFNGKVNLRVLFFQHSVDTNDF